MSISTTKRLMIICVLGLGLLAFVGAHSVRVSAAPQSCTLPATVTTATELADCITAANAGSGGTITLGADITLTSALPQIASAITVQGAGYAIDGGNSVRIFDVGAVGDLTINQITLRNGSEFNGGAIYNDGSLTVTNSAFVGNSANNGGAIANRSLSTVTVSNSTFSGNSASNAGGAIHSVSTLILTNNTFFGNSATNGSTLYNFSTMHLAGNLFAGGLGSNNCANNNTLNDNGYNLSDDSTCTNSGTGSATNATPNLGALADNGGSTLTHLPSTGSDAIGAIPNGTTISNNGTIWACKASTPFVDQRGEPRPQNSTDDCTAGAVEVATNSTTLTIIKDADPAVGTDFDFTINSAPLPSYSGSTSSNPFWTRPNEGGTCTLSTVSTRYHVQAFMVDVSGTYNMVSNQNYNGYLHLYQDSFNPLNQCANYLYGDNNTLISNQSEINYSLEPGRVYYLVTSGFGATDAGTYTNDIARNGGGGNAYTLYDLFTLDDAAPDDGDGHSSTVTYDVTPGTHTVSEVASSSWNLTSATCTGASGGYSLTGEDLSVAVGAGEAVECTFTNAFAVDCGNIMNESELSICIANANSNGAGLDTLTLGANISLTSALPRVTSTITVEGAGYAIDGGDSVRIFNVGSGGNFTVNEATLQNGNSGEDNGGGIRNISGNVVVTNSTLSGNTIVGTFFGGAIFNSGGTLIVNNSTISGNTTDYSPGIYNSSGGTLIVSNSTISDNVARVGFSGGITNWSGTATLTHNTFSGNSSSASFNPTADVLNESGNVYLAGNIFADASGGNVHCSNGTGITYDNGYNLSSDTTCVDGGTGSVTNATLNLGALAANGGPTQTHLPGAGSDAIGAIPYGTTISNNGTSWSCDQSATDQRGELRPLNAGTACTAGAVEVALPPTCTSWTVTTADELAVCITLANANESPSPTADTITLGADITLSTALPQITSEITLEGAGYTVDGGNSVQLFQVASSGDFTVNQATLQNGFASNGGGILNDGLLTVNNSTISGNSATENGGGIANDNGTVTVTNSTFSGNTASTYGGGIYNGTGTVGVSNSTFSGNVANNNGAAILNDDGSVGVTNSTFSDNFSFGIIVNYFAGGEFHLAGNIFAGNNASSNCDNAGTLHDNGYNLSDDATCTNGGTGSVTNATLPLGVLADNGGPTLTHALLAGSDAIDAIPAGACSLSEDQRGVSRPQGVACDVGAYEAVMVCAVGESTPYVLGDVQITFQAGGLGDVDCVEVKAYDRDHPDATQGLRIGAYWHIAATASGGGAASGYTADLTISVPFVPDASDQLCRYTGSDWDCGASSFDAGLQTITRQGVTQFSDWAAGTSGPLAVTLASFAAAPDGDHIRVTWETVSEIDTAGFNLYRTETADPPAASDLLAWIPSQGPGSAQGYFYSYGDHAVAPGVPYWYWLEDVDLNGVAALHGPVEAILISPTAVTVTGLAATSGQPALPAWLWMVLLAVAGATMATARWRRSHT